MVVGEARFHTCLEAEARGIALLLPGHFASERFALECLADVLSEQFPQLKIWPSRRETDPLRVDVRKDRDRDAGIAKPQRFCDSFP